MCETVFNGGMTKHLIAATLIAAVSLVGFAGAAHGQAAPVCTQPGSNPPIVVDCASPEVTTPYVPAPTTTVPVTSTTIIQTVGTPSNPFPNGTCWQPGSNPPRLVDCTTPAATTPYVPTPTTIAPPAATSPVMAPAVDTSIAPSAAPTMPIVRHIAVGARLPATGSSPNITIVGVATLLVGSALLLAGRRNGSV